MAEKDSVARRRAFLEAELESYLSLWREKYHPQQVWVLVSLASGETDLRFLDRTKEVMQLLRPRVGADILVYTPSEFEQLCRERPFFHTEILKKGKIVYDRRK